MPFTQAAQPIRRVVIRVTRVSSSVKEVTNDGSDWTVIIVQELITNLEQLLGLKGYDVKSAKLVPRDMLCFIYAKLS